MVRVGEDGERAVFKQALAVQHLGAARTARRSWKTEDDHVGATAVFRERRGTAGHGDSLARDLGDAASKVAVEGRAFSDLVRSTSIGIGSKPSLHGERCGWRLDGAQPAGAANGDETTFFADKYGWALDVRGKAGAEQDGDRAKDLPPASR
jgi:hypothetical protein